MPLPDDNPFVATITSNTSNLRGNKDLQIVLKAKYSSTEAYSMTISDIGGYEFAIDVQEDSDDITEFLYNVPTFEFSFWSDLNGADDFGNILDNLTFQDLVTIEVTYNGSTDLFICQKTDFEYNRLKREVTCSANSPFKYTDTVETYDISARTFEGTWTAPLGAETTYDCITVRDLISGYLDTIGVSTTERVKSQFEITRSDLLALNIDETEGVNIYVTSNEGNVGVDTPQGTDNEFVVDSFTDARNAVLEMGILESAIVGTMFQEVFYVRRDYNPLTPDVDFYQEIDASDLEEFDIEFSTGAVKSIDINNQSDLVGTGNQIITVSAGYARDALFTRKGIDGDEIEITGANEVNLETLASDSIDIYKKVLGVSDAIKFSGTILGTEKLKPYQFARLNTNISPFVTSDNRDIRVSYIKYNLKEDKIEFEGYSI